jgi:hypothetical protein
MTRLSASTPLDVITGAILNNCIVKGTWTASGTWTIPAVTLGGAVAGGGVALTTLGSLSFGSAAIISSTVDNSYIMVRGGTGSTNHWGGSVRVDGFDSASVGTVAIATSKYDGSDNTVRVTFSAAPTVANVGVVTWANATHTGLAEQ